MEFNEISFKTFALHMLTKAYEDLQDDIIDNQKMIGKVANYNHLVIRYYFVTGLLQKR